MRGSWVKVVVFILVATMLGGLASVMLDSGLGKPDELNRVKHPAGWSFVPPRGWGASPYFSARPKDDNWMRVSPERSTGRQPSIGIILHPGAMTPPATAKPFSFQGLPAFKTIYTAKSDWIWKLDFERDGKWFSMSVSSPIAIDIEGGELWPFLQSFRTEPVFQLSSTMTGGAATMPASPASPALPATLP